jgi:hypothetical protein
MRNYENAQRRKVAFWVILSCESSFYCTGALQNIIRAKKTTDEGITTHIINNNWVIGEYIIVFAGHIAKNEVCWVGRGFTSPLDAQGWIMSKDALKFKLSCALVWFAQMLDAVRTWLPRP